jgi:PAS domain S-box-containing protein
MSRGGDGNQVVGLPAERLARRLAALPRESLLAEIDSLYANSPVGLVLFDRGLTYVRLNEALAAMNGVPLAEHLGRTPFEVVPDVMRMAFDPFMQVFETGEAHRDVEVRGETPRAPGVECVWRNSVFPVKGPGGKVEYILVTVEEVTSLEQAERRAHLAESHLDLALRTHGLGTFEHGETFDDITWSPTVYQFYGLPADQPVPLAECLRMTPPAYMAQLDEVRRRTLAGENLPPTEYPVHRADGTVRWLSVVARRFDTKHGRRVIGTYEDVTERVLERAALQEREREKAFLLRLSDTLRPLADASEIQQAAARLLAEELGADRIYHAMIEPGLEACVVDCEYRRRTDAPSTVGRFPLSGIPAFAASVRTGEILVEDDVAASPRLVAGEKELLERFQIASYVHRPMTKHGRAETKFVVTCERPRAWTPAEVRLIEETAERTWAAAERARTEAALRRSERRFRTLADTVPALVWHSDPDGKTVFVNRHYLDFAGLPEEAFRGRRWVSFIHPDDVAAHSAAYVDATRGRRHWHGRLRIRQRDRTWRWIDASAEPFVDDSGTYQGQVGVALDVTEQVTSAAALRDSEARFRVLVERIQQVFYVADLKANRALYISPAFEEIWGRPGAPLRADLSSLMETVHPEDRPGMEAHAASVRGGRACTFEYRIVRPDGSVRWILDRSFPVEGAEGERSAGLAMDITEQKKQAVALEQAVAQKDVLLHEIQHRVKNSLSLVHSLLQLQASATEDVEARGALADAAGRVRIIAQLQDQLYRLGDLSAVDLGSCLFEVSQSVAEHAGRAPQVRLRTELEQLVVPGKAALPVLLIVNELLTNAYKYAFPNGRTGTVRLSLESADGEARIRVADDGVGLAEGGPHSPGLGTRVTQGLAAQLHGKLEHVPGEGCSFLLSFPLPSRATATS